MALLCLFEHKRSQKKVVIGNAHFDWSADRDFVKFAQANFLLDKTALFIRRHEEKDSILPLVLSGDYNSMPVSSVLSAFYGEDIEDDENCSWQCPQVKKLKSKYVKINTLYKQKRK